MSTQYYIGTSGWHYEHWQNRFYPKKLTKVEWLQFYASNFTTVELNNTFYRLPSEATFTTWHDSSPPDFVFAVKVSRFITHIKRLKNCEEAVDKFISRAKILGRKLGPLLYQLPPNMHRNDKVLESFLSALPQGMKHVFEFRHESWLDNEVFDMLQRHNASFCVFDLPFMSCPLIATSDFAYIRFHGSLYLYSSCYSDEELVDWAKRLANLAANMKTIYIYFNNDAEAFAIKNAIALRRYLEMEKV